MGRPNILILMSDEHARRVMGAYGDDIVQTPNLDRLAAQSMVFDAAYTPSPICVPARAAIATGKPIHETGHWDNAHPYEGTPESWGHVLAREGYRVESIGKLHYRGTDADTGFAKQTLPMHVTGGIGDLTGSIRTPPPLRAGSRKLAERLGPGESDYTRYDRAVRDAAITRLELAAATGEDGLVLLVSFVAPHFPLIAPKEFYDLYANVPLAPRMSHPDKAAQHPWLKALRNSYAYDNFDDEKRTRALRSYYGLVSFLDDNIGAVLGALESSGRAPDTSVLYFSDHGDNLGERGMWGKSTFFEDSVGVPLMIRPARSFTPRRVTTPVSLTDIHATLLDIADTEKTGIGESLLPLVDGSDAGRAVLSQYHAAGAPTGAYMLRRGSFKLIHYDGYPPQLFNLSEDPFERTNLAGSPEAAGDLQRLTRCLFDLLDPAATSRQALSAQSELLRKHGGSNQIQNRDSGFSGTPVPNARLQRT